jgi:hypothetical protein
MSSLQCDEVKTHVVTNLISTGTYQCRQTIPILLVMGFFQCCGSMFLGLPDPDPLVRGMDPDPNPALDPDPSIIMQK